MDHYSKLKEIEELPKTNWDNFVVNLDSAIDYLKVIINNDPKNTQELSKELFKLIQIANNISGSKHYK